MICLRYETHVVQRHRNNLGQIDSKLTGGCTLLIIIVSSQAILLRRRTCKYAEVRKVQLSPSSLESVVSDRMFYGGLGICGLAWLICSVDENHSWCGCTTEWLEVKWPVDWALYRALESVRDVRYNTRSVGSDIKQEVMVTSIWREDRE